MKNHILIILLGVLFTLSMGTALAQDMEANDTEAFQQALEQDGFMYFIIKPRHERS